MTNSKTKTSEENILDKLVNNFVIVAFFILFTLIFLLSGLIVGGYFRGYLK